MLSILILFLALLCGGLWFVVLRVVAVRQALIVLSGVTGRATRTVTGPATTLVWPWQNAQVVDLSTQSSRLIIDTAVTTDLSVLAYLDVLYGFDALLLNTADLDRILPSLNQSNRIVNAWAEYAVRSLVATVTTTELLTHAPCRAQLENQLTRTLQAHVRRFGLRIYTVRLICLPTPEMLEAQLAAERMKLEAEARAQALKQLKAAAGSGHDLSRLLSLDLLQTAKPGESLLFTAVDLPGKSPSSPTLTKLRKRALGA